MDSNGNFMKRSKKMEKLIMYRLIAGEGKLVTNGELTGKVIDVAPNLYVNDFYEIDDEEEKEEENKRP